MLSQPHLYLPSPSHLPWPISLGEPLGSCMTCSELTMQPTYSGFSLAASALAVLLAVLLLTVLAARYLRNLPVSGAEKPGLHANGTTDPDGIQIVLSNNAESLLDFIAPARWLVLSICSAVLSVFLFSYAQDITATAVLFDKSSLSHIILLTVQLACSCQVLRARAGQLRKDRMGASSRPGTGDRGQKDARAAAPRRLRLRSGRQGQLEDDNEV